MRAVVLLAAACLALTAGRELADPSRLPQGAQPVQLYGEESFLEEQSPETVLLVDEGNDGSLHVTGMLQNFRLEGGGFEGANAALDRPHASFLDLAWSSWVDERLEVFDLLQALLAPRPHCPHMQQAGAETLDTSMVSYLASSRFGPAILTTYAQSFLDEGEDADDDFDYASVSVSLPEGDGLPGKSYADASLLEGLSADADRAFERQQAFGFFGAQLRTAAQEQESGWARMLDGDAESLQPSILLEQPDSFRPEILTGNAERLQGRPSAGGQPSAGLALFLLLLVGCVFVWVRLIRSCCRVGAELRGQQSKDAAATHKLAQQELLMPLVAEGAKPLPAVEVAAGRAPAGTYFAPSAVGYATVAVPLQHA